MQAGTINCESTQLGLRPNPEEMSKSSLNSWYKLFYQKTFDVVSVPLKLQNVVKYSGKVSIYWVYALKFSSDQL